MSNRWNCFVLPTVALITSMTQVSVLAQTTPQSVVDQFYRWYVVNQNSGREKIGQQKAAFTPELYQELVKAFQRQPNDGAWLDVDPFFGGQSGGSAYTVGSVHVFSDFYAQVEVTIADFRGNRTNPIMVFLTKQSGRWQISNLVYFDGSSLLCELQDINRSPRKRPPVR